MKKPTVAILFLVCFTLTGCSQKETTEKELNTVNKTVQDTISVGWPNDINGLIDHLNTWYKDELDAYERPDAYPNLATSGETNGWVEEHKRMLKELGANVFWNKEKKRYELMKK